MQGRRAFSGIDKASSFIESIQENRLTNLNGAKIF
jgi:hypothetical protein